MPYWLADDLIVPAQSLPQPFDFSFEIHPIIFHANDLIGVIVTLLCDPRALFAFLRFTSIGIALRASSRERGPLVAARRERRLHPQRRVDDRRLARRRSR